MINLFFWLIVGHVFADFVWQSEFMAKGKNHVRPLPDIPWWIVMSAHCVVHAAVVAVVTGSVLLSGFEFIIHFKIDYDKSSDRHGFETDQLLHVLCKLFYVIMLAYDKTPLP